MMLHRCYIANRVSEPNDVLSCWNNNSKWKGDVYFFLKLAQNKRCFPSVIEVHGCKVLFFHGFLLLVNLPLRRLNQDINRALHELLGGEKYFESSTLSPYYYNIG